MALREPFDALGEIASIRQHPRGDDAAHSTRAPGGAVPEENKSVDLLGIKPVGDAALVATKGAVAGAGAFLSRICLPAAEEFGLLLQDRVRAWRAEQALKITMKAQARYEDSDPNTARHAHPRIVGSILEHGSWEDDDSVQDMWAGLLASSCTSDGKSQANLIFVNLLKAMTTSQALIISYACQKAEKKTSTSGLILANGPYVTIEELMELSRLRNVHELDVELDHLREIGLLGQYSGFNPDNIERNLIEPTPLALNFYARCQGHVGTVLDFYALPERPRLRRVQLRRMTRPQVVRLRGCQVCHAPSQTRGANVTRSRKSSKSLNLYENYGPVTATLRPRGPRRAGCS